VIIVVAVEVEHIMLAEELWQQAVAVLVAVAVAVQVIMVRVETVLEHMEVEQAEVETTGLVEELVVLDLLRLDSLLITKHLYLD
jgi:hypothetical protein